MLLLTEKFGNAYKVRNLSCLHDLRNSRHFLSFKLGACARSQNSHTLIMFFRSEILLHRISITATNVTLGGFNPDSPPYPSRNSSLALYFPLKFWRLRPPTRPPKFSMTFPGAVAMDIFFTITLGVNH